ncbi:nitrilase and fragile histidine triad fusion protein NitFhit isoform X2 [Orussus abietinus]|nr:nitrilase and fragile histidine triad fusion protein NitFhit isoform X2 [Orussus abietinus]
MSVRQKAIAAVCQMTTTVDKTKNLGIVSELVAEAKQRLATIAFFPEACDYLADNKKDIVAMAEPLDGPTIQSYKKLAKDHQIWLSFGGIHEKLPDESEKICNTHILINSEGQVAARYRKVHLFDMENKEIGVRLMESDYVVKGSEIVSPIATPIGQLGLSICYDMRFPELALALRNMGAEILTYPSAFTYETGAAHWEVLLRSRAIESQCYVIAAAQIGKHNKKRTSWGHAMIIDPWGSMIAQCSDTIGIAVAEVDLKLLEKIRKNMPCENHRRIDLYPKVQALNTSL